MTLTDLFLAELDREVPRSRKALEHVPEGKADWKPHARSMPLGYLAMLVAMMPDWIARIIDHDQLDVAPKDAEARRPEPPATRAGLLDLLDRSAAQARVALKKTSDSEAPRYVVIGDTMNHLAHHRGQLTVYLRMAGGKLPSVYGPTADEPWGP